jgi:hypothetical protein
MRWIFENLNLIIVIAGAIAWWINQRAREKSGDAADYDDDGIPESRPKPDGFEDPQLAERTRKIREEIQRKIAERRKAGEGYTEPARPVAAPLQTPAPPAETRPPVVVASPEYRAPQPIEPPVVREVLVKSANVAEARRRAEILEQQATLADQLRQAEEMKAAAGRRAAYERITQDNTAIARRGARASIVEDLRDPAALRRAFLHREILGPPVGLR